jgi:hypothetical protein
LRPLAVAASQRPKKKGEMGGSRHPRRLSRQRPLSRAQQDCLQLTDAPVDARLRPEPVADEADVQCSLGADVLARFLGYVPVVYRLHRLLRAQSN